MAVQAKTRKVDSIVVKDEFMKNELGKINSIALADKIRSLESKVDDITSGKYGIYPKIENKPFYYFTNGKFFIVDPKRYLVPDSGGVETNVEGVKTTFLTYDKFIQIFNTHSSCPIYSGYDNSGKRIIKNKDGAEFIRVLGYYNNYYNFYSIKNNGSDWYYYGSYNYQKELGSDVLRLPISNVSSSFSSLLQYNLMPSDLTQEEKNLFALLVKYFEKGWITFSSGKFESLSNEFFVNLKKNLVDDFGDILFKQESIEKYVKDGGKVHFSGDSYDAFVQKLVNVDKVRIDLSAYEESRLTDPNGGHWDLWSTNAGENETLLNLDSSFYGRNPVADVKADGIIGIDFGTKSTVVTVQNGTETITPMRIGCGNLKKDVTASDYENPTVMEFINLEKFIERYNSSKSRPETEWVDLTISHTASNSLNENNGNKYYAWFSDLKQWASDKNRKVIIRDIQGKETELSPFVDINDNDLNPIEYYAYLLGLFINNMYNGIYINYILSFPVTYERKIKQKIEVSFSDGLKKSLPAPVLEDKNVMKDFRVMEGASEPAAYAVCALQEYGFKPEEDEKILYGIFDFGGGTTDFDFGTWQRAPKKIQRRYDYVINHFGAGGDRLLGGENLLELLAYSVFKSNEAVLREKEIQFTKPANADKYCGLFEGSEALISDSQQAKFNQKQLAEEFRPLWHGEDYDKEKTTINLYNTKGELETIELIVDVEDLKSLIRKRIDSGVENFFEAMNKAVTSEIANGVDKIQIFLAGNSSKSDVVTESFDYYKEKYLKTFAEKLNVTIKSDDNKDNKSPKNYFVDKYSKDSDSWYYFIKKCGLPESYLKKIPVDDSFMSELSIENFCGLLYCAGEILMSNSEDEIQNALLNIWKEGFLPADKMAEIPDVLRADWDSDLTFYAVFMNFIYSNAETSDELRRELENYSPEFIKSIADETSAFIKKKAENEIFVVYPPLGTEKSDNIRRNKGLDISTSVTRPTGKTGVAYGLLECRPGARIKVESEISDTDEIKFNFYTGYLSMGKFTVTTDRDIEYNKWIEFIDASESDFELYYTDLPEAATNQMSINGVSKKICRIDETMDDAMVYIRAVEPSVLEYCAAVSEEELNNKEYLSPPKKIILE
jgi:hypothetical protein